MVRGMPRATTSSLWVNLTTGLTSWRTSFAYAQIITLPAILAQYGLTRPRCARLRGMVVSQQYIEYNNQTVYGRNRLSDR